MEIHAYNELFVESAQNIFGHMFDYSLNEIGIDAEKLGVIIKTSSIIRQFGKGNTMYITGITGPELAKIVIENAGLKLDYPDEVMYMDKSPEYWAGWSVAYYQWIRNISFSEILKAVSITDILKMYNPYHEMDVMSFVEVMDEKLKDNNRNTRLKSKREQAGLSQSELSKVSGVPVRQIQLFEQRRRDINKTQAITLLKLSKALFCNVEDIMEMLQ